MPLFPASYITLMSANIFKKSNKPNPKSQRRERKTQRTHQMLNLRRRRMPIGLSLPRHPIHPLLTQFLQPLRLRHRCRGRDARLPRRESVRAAIRLRARPIFDLICAASCRGGGGGVEVHDIAAIRVFFVVAGESSRTAARASASSEGRGVVAQFIESVFHRG